MRKYMGFFDKLFGKKPEPIKEEVPKKEKKPRKPKQPKIELTAKEQATRNGEPYINIVKMELDPNDINNGAFELDWNDKFIVNLVKAGYQQKPGETEDVIVDRWFQNICRNVVQENYEQWEANQPADARPRNMDRRDLGDGRSEIS